MIIDDKKITFEGKIRWCKKKLVIEELPPEMTVSSYKEILDKFMADGIISKFTEHHLENKIKFEIYGFED